MGKAKSSDINFWFRDDKLIKIKYNLDVDSDYIPPSKITDDIQRLVGFEWKISKRPKRSFFVFDDSLLKFFPKEYFLYVDGFLEPNK